LAGTFDLDATAESTPAGETLRVSIESWLARQQSTPTTAAWLETVAQKQSLTAEVETLAADERDLFAQVKTEFGESLQSRQKMLESFKDSTFSTIESALQHYQEDIRTRGEIAAEIKAAKQFKLLQVDTRALQVQRKQIDVQIAHNKAFIRDRLQFLLFLYDMTCLAAILTQLFEDDQDNPEMWSRKVQKFQKFTQYFVQFLKISQAIGQFFTPILK
jgi:hypothetical protein